MGATAAIIGAVAAVGGVAVQADAARKAGGVKKTAMPVVDDKTTEEARRRSLAEQIGRKGRQSTILTGGDETLG